MFIQDTPGPTQTPFQSPENGRWKRGDLEKASYPVLSGLSKSQQKSQKQQGPRLYKEAKSQGNMLLPRSHGNMLHPLESQQHAPPPLVIKYNKKNLVPPTQTWVRDSLTVNRPPWRNRELGKPQIMDLSPLLLRNPSQTLRHFIFLSMLLMNRSLTAENVLIVLITMQLPFNTL